MTATSATTRLRHLGSRYHIETISRFLETPFKKEQPAIDRERERILTRFQGQTSEPLHEGFPEHVWNEGPQVTLDDEHGFPDGIAVTVLPNASGSERRRSIGQQKKKSLDPSRNISGRHPTPVPISGRHENPDLGAWLQAGDQVSECVFVHHSSAG
jgi:hypothetical protein